MDNSTEKRILTTHVGSLPRPASLIPLLMKQDEGGPVDAVELAAAVSESVTDIVGKQIQAGVDIVSDGEMSKWSYTNYMKHRIAGFDGESETQLLAPADLVENKEFAEHLRSSGVANPLKPPACTGPLAVKDTSALQADLDNFSLAIQTHQPMRAFMNAASPGVISIFMPNQYYQSDDDYVSALAQVLQNEYESIVNAGFDLQLDAPDLAMGRHTAYTDLSLDQFKRAAHRNMLALNHATRNIPPERMRMHLCWGNYPGPHTHDIPISEVFDIVMQARPAYILFESANARHNHEVATFEERRNDIPDHKVLVPGVLDTNSNCVEHPELVAQRLLRFANVVGRDRIVAGTDCGFSTVASRPRVFPSLVWQKLAAMRDGANLASDKLWRH
ncbi:MAG: cobalamin-independent methionine synthase II family protein [Burkholderiaceae bacterium]